MPVNFSTTTLRITYYSPSTTAPSLPRTSTSHQPKKISPSANQDTELSPNQDTGPAVPTASSASSSLSSPPEGIDCYSNDYHYSNGWYSNTWHINDYFSIKMLQRRLQRQIRPHTADDTTEAATAGLAAATSVFSSAAGASTSSALPTTSAP